MKTSTFYFLVSIASIATKSVNGWGCIGGCNVQNDDDFNDDSPSINDFMYIVNITDISQLDCDNDNKWIPQTKIFIANRNDGSGDINYVLEGTKVEATYQKGQTSFTIPVNCYVNSNGGCILESSSSVQRSFINNNIGAKSAKFIVTAIDNPISEYNAEFNEVDTTLVVWD
eukprot:CAMPEP_0194409184 /NCGR_PEP_ID=MMETSP0176-20130528/7010_1 /TAXON_ID=216777 /ORGANISM="Proboscia alata, Strain PI-D3" /LENGTH=170 /DNA_ID=CAMNT_0039209617 /DNA_START=102 /DNA_END=611 /DNA_ORIENTATION=+